MDQIPRPIAANEDEPEARRSSTVIEFDLNGDQVQVADSGETLLEVLRGSLGIRSVKDGCSPQGQCGCCTVLVDDRPRVACVTPLRRVSGRRVTTLEGLDPARRARWANRFCETGASQCGFCTPGIIMRLDALEVAGTGPGDVDAVKQALLAHLCRCTGWQTIVEAWGHDGSADPGRDLEAAARRATIEGGTPQRVGPDVALGSGGFAADTAPQGSIVMLQDRTGTWRTGSSLAAARAAAGAVQGRRTTASLRWPVEVPAGEWTATLQTTWVEPAYLETDASWCAPGGTPASPLANGGAFGSKVASPTPLAARRAAESGDGDTYLALLTREDTVRRGPKRPPVAAGVRPDGSGVMMLGITTDDDHGAVVGEIRAVAPDLEVRLVPIDGPPTLPAVRAAGWTEAVALLAAGRGRLDPVTAPNGATATAAFVDGTIQVTVRCGRILDDVVLRSYCIGAAHMAFSMVMSEALTVDDRGEVHDLTIRSFGIVRAIDTPPIAVELLEDDGPAVNGSDAVFAAVAAATWMRADFAPQWPVGDMMGP